MQTPILTLFLSHSEKKKKHRRPWWTRHIAEPCKNFTCTLSLFSSIFVILILLLPGVYFQYMWIPRVVYNIANVISDLTAT